MSQPIFKTDSKSISWLSTQRYRVGQSVNHNGFIWSNLTGINSEPGIGTDWLKTYSDDDKSPIELVPSADAPSEIFVIADDRIVQQVYNNGTLLDAASWSQNLTSITVTPFGGLFADGYVTII